MDSGELTPKRPRSPENEGEPCLWKRAKTSSSGKRGTKRSRTSDGEEQDRQKRIKISSCENRGMKRCRTPDGDDEESSSLVFTSDSHVSKWWRISDSDEEQCKRDREVTAPKNQGESYVPALRPTRPLGQALADYTFHRMLGRGGFGEVMLASLKATNQQLAIKVMEKEPFLNASFRTERNVLQVARGCPFLCHGLAAFQTQEFAYLVLEYVRGGTLNSFMKRRGHLTLDEVRSLLVQMICGLQYLHSCGIIHRDLKPENILMSDDGHIKIADFGLAAENMPGGRVTRGRIGTPFFLAPEPIGRKRGTKEPPHFQALPRKCRWGHLKLTSSRLAVTAGVLKTVGLISLKSDHCGTLASEQLSLRSYGASVDWWALGVIFSIMLTGKYPFDDTGTVEMYQDEVLKTRHRYPSELPKDAEDLLNKLLDKKPETRLGVAGNIRQHPFFQSINWEEVESCQAVPPCCPTTSQDRQKVIPGEDFRFMDDCSYVTDSQKIFGLSFVAPDWPE